jgi:hypothetical protein
MGGTGDEWRVEVDLDEPDHGFKLGERLRSLDLDDAARERLGDRVVVTRDGPRMFLYAGDARAAREAEGVARDLIASEGLAATISVTRWHPDREDWVDAAEPLPQTEEARTAERQEAEAEGEAEPPGRWDYAWEVRVDLPTLRDTRELARRLEGEGIEARRRWKYLIVGAGTEERATELAERIGDEAPAGSSVHIGTAGAPHPVFVFLGAHEPGIARDLGI